MTLLYALRSRRIFAMQQSLRLFFGGSAFLAGLALSGWAATALEPGDGEKSAIKACEQQLCTMVLGRAPAGPDLQCDIAKTWDRSTLKKGESASLTWGFGDARCAVDLKLSRADVVAALTKPKHIVQVPEHEVQCLVEQDGKAKPVVAKLAPKLEFKKGKADKIWINLSEIEGPTAVKATVNMAASLEDTLGIFHGSMLKSVNRFLHKRCDQRYHADGSPKPEPEKKKKKKASNAEEEEDTADSDDGVAKKAAKPDNSNAVAAEAQ